jgi:DNA-binding SARP family transcriptional activator
VQLRLLDAFALTRDGEEVRLPNAAQRLVAFVALHERPVLRDYVAGTLWLDVSDDRAAGNLRSALWRVQRHAPGLVRSDGRLLRLDGTVRVDLRDAERAARDASVSDARLFAADLLPDWYDDDWVLLERERFRQLRLHTLDALSARHLGAGRFGEALDAAMLSLAGEPLRESAHRALVRVHLAEGNAAEALRQYDLCRRLLHDQLGLEPTQEMRELIGTLDAAETER